MKMPFVRSIASRAGALAAAAALGALGAAALPAVAAANGPTADRVYVEASLSTDPGYIRQGRAAFWLCADNVQDNDPGAYVTTATADISAFGMSWPGVNL